MSNNPLRFPVLTSVALSGNTATISGTLNSTPNSTFAIDFFASQIWDTTHYGEGQKYLGSISVTTDASGNASFTATMPGVPSGFNYFAATATDSNGNTSEFCYDPEAGTPLHRLPPGRRSLPSWVTGRRKVSSARSRSGPTADPRPLYAAAHSPRVPSAFLFFANLAPSRLNSVQARPTRWWYA